MTDTSKEAAWDALMNYQQADEEGIMVLVSRQAIHECKDERDALTAYRQARENADGVNTDGLFNDIEDILYDCIVSIQGEVSGLEEAYSRITVRIKAALEETK